MLLHTQVPFSTWTNHFDHVSGNAEQQERPGDKVSFTYEVIAPVNVSFVGWEAGLIRHVAVPQTAMVGGQIAQVAERANPAFEDLPIVDPIFAGNLLLIRDFHHGQ